MTRTRVLHLSKHLLRGGAEVLLSTAARSVDRDRFRLAFAYSTAGANVLQPELEAAGAEVFYVRKGLGPLPFSIAELTALVRSWRPDILHAHLPLVGSTARIVGALTSTRVVYTEHNLFSRYHLATQAAARATWPLQSHVLAVSRAVADDLAAFTRSGVAVSVVENAVEVERFGAPALRAQGRALMGIDGDVDVVGTVAVFRDAKRLDLWLEVARRVAEARPASRFVVVGFGPLEAALRARAADLGLGDRVVFAGAQTDVRPWLAAMDAWLMTSDWEGLPVALLEAMASAVPVVATAVGGVPGVVGDGVSGLLAPAGDVALLTRHVLATLDDRAAAAARAVAARAVVEDRFGAARFGAHLGDVYDRVLAGER